MDLFLFVVTGTVAVITGVSIGEDVGKGHEHEQRQRKRYTHRKSDSHSVVVTVQCRLINNDRSDASI